VGHSIDIQAIEYRLSEAAREAGLPFRGNQMLYNSRLAQELGLWGESRGKGNELHAALFRAYFVDGKNIADIPVLVELATSVNLQKGEATEILATRAFRAAVDADWALSKEKHITAVPTLVMNQSRLVGAHPYEALERLMETNGVKRRGF
jgi:predicted DsbA family dithiol-disulfide isomerase